MGFGLYNEEVEGIIRGPPVNNWNSNWQPWYIKGGQVLQSLEIVRHAAITLDVHVRHGFTVEAKDRAFLDQETERKRHDVLPWTKDCMDSHY